MSKKPDWRKTKLGWRAMPILLSSPIWVSLCVIGAVIGWAAVFFFAGYQLSQEAMLKAREAAND